MMTHQRSAPARSLPDLGRWIAWLLLLFGLGLGGLQTPATAGDAGVAAAAERLPATPDEALRATLDLERARDWSAAIDTYEAALDRWPQRVDFRHRLRLCQAHYRLARRYADASFREVLLGLSRNQSLRLYDEVVERIESHYVDAVGLVPLLRRGLDNVEVALREPEFLAANARTSDPARVRWLRDALAKRRAQLVARTRAEAVAVAAESCDYAEKALGIPAAAIALEFTYGACDALPDDYSVCLTPDKLDDLFAVIDGEFVGLGVELKGDPLGLRLVGVIGGGPAAEAGLVVGDRILEADGRRLEGLGLDEAAAFLQGPEGSALELSIRDRLDRDRRVRLVRREVEVHSVVQAEIVEPVLGIGYVRLDGFQKSSAAELRQAIGGLSSKGMRVLVLDVRGNPGGLLDSAVEIADEFLDDGVIVSTRGRAREQTAVYRAHPGAAWRMPVALLVDHDSASASEILAGALQENHRAVLLGERSYGKGSVQSIFPLRTAPAGLKLTTAKFYSPTGRGYSERGVEPDEPVTLRTAARPPADGALDLAAFGDPVTDLTLARAIALVRERSGSSQ